LLAPHPRSEQSFVLNERRISATAGMARGP